jgi:hypothetical protein
VSAGKQDLPSDHEVMEPGTMWQLQGRGLEVLS